MASCLGGGEGAVELLVSKYLVSHIAPTSLPRPVCGPFSGPAILGYAFWGGRPSWLPGLVGGREKNWARNGTRMENDNDVPRLESARHYRQGQDGRHIARRESGVAASLLLDGPFRCQLRTAGVPGELY